MAVKAQKPNCKVTREQLSGILCVYDVVQLSPQPRFIISIAPKENSISIQQSLPLPSSSQALATTNLHTVAMNLLNLDVSYSLPLC